MGGAEGVAAAEGAGGGEGARGLAEWAVEEGEEARGGDAGCAGVSTGSGDERGRQWKVHGARRRRRRRRRGKGGRGGREEMGGGIVVQGWRRNVERGRGRSMRSRRGRKWGGSGRGMAAICCGGVRAVGDCSRVVAPMGRVQLRRPCATARAITAAAASAPAAPASAPASASATPAAAIFLAAIPAGAALRLSPLQQALSCTRITLVSHPVRHPDVAVAIEESHCGDTHECRRENTARTRCITPCHLAKYARRRPLQPPPCVCARSLDPPCLLPLARARTPRPAQFAFVAPALAHRRSDSCSPNSIFGLSRCGALLASSRAPPLTSLSPLATPACALDSITPVSPAPNGLAPSATLLPPPSERDACTPSPTTGHLSLPFGQTQAIYGQSS